MHWFLAQVGSVFGSFNPEWLAVAGGAIGFILRVEYRLTRIETKVEDLKGKKK